MREAAVLANIAASIVVGEVGTAPITLEKLLRAVEQHNSEQKIRRVAAGGGAPHSRTNYTPWGTPAVGRTGGKVR
jgi:bifunctional ADP-heptose synthase (sugar kinase/adenylyltransferase)